MDDMKVRTVDQPEGTGEYFSAGDIAAGLSYARQTERTLLGGIHSQVYPAEHLARIGQRICARHRNAVPHGFLGGLVVGASLSNFGTSMRLDGRDTRQFGRVDDT